jgi:hypothetical protein
MPNHATEDMTARMIMVGGTVHFSKAAIAL